MSLYNNNGCILIILNIIINIVIIINIKLNNNNYEMLFKFFLYGVVTAENINNLKSN